MGVKGQFLILSSVALLGAFSTWAYAQQGYKAGGEKLEGAETAAPILWSDPVDIASRNLF